MNPIARITLFSLIGFALVMLCVVTSSFADDGANVIGGSQTIFSFAVCPFLVARTPEEIPGVQAFNYFCTIEVFAGLLAASIKSIYKIIPGV